MSEEGSKEFRLSKAWMGDGEPVRCMSVTFDGRLLVGSDGGGMCEVEMESGKPTNNDNSNDDDDDCMMRSVGMRHSHSITAMTYHNGMIVTGCKDHSIRIFDSKEYDCIKTLTGHSNAVTSLAWLDDSSSSMLLSGSWDGSAKVWNVSTGECMATLPNHENSVCVLGLPSKNKIVTGSAGIAQGMTGIKDHTIRIYETKSTNGSMTMTVDLVSQVANDHMGPIRDLAYDYDTNTLLSCSNDGTVKVRDENTGESLVTLDCQNPDSILLCVQYLGNGRILASSENGYVYLWQHQTLVQTIPHPNCVWKVMSNNNNSDFLTACQDDFVRLFTTDDSKVASDEKLIAFANESDKSKKAGGPSTEEIAKLPKWEMNQLTVGRSEGQVQIFNKDGIAIAAQWSAASKTWIEVGQVMGSKDDTTTSLNGVEYDFVFPIDVDLPDGSGTTRLQIGYNHGDNPFVIAQQFIDQHQLSQSYLSQIADYIQSRTNNTTRTTLGSSSTTNSTSNANDVTMTMATPTPTKTYKYIPVKVYKWLDMGTDSLKKLLSKWKDLTHTSGSNNNDDVLEGLCQTLAATSRYHATTIHMQEMNHLITLLQGTPTENVFPMMDVSRLLLLHHASSSYQQQWSLIIKEIMRHCQSVVNEPSKYQGTTAAMAVPLISLRFFANIYHHSTITTSNADVVTDFLPLCQSLINTSHKATRLALTTVLLNTTSHLANNSSNMADSSKSKIVDFLLSIIESILTLGVYEAEATVRTLVSLGTLLLINPSSRTIKTKAQSMPITQAHAGPTAKLVGDEILQVLQS